MTYGPVWGKKTRVFMGDYTLVPTKDLDFLINAYTEQQAYSAALEVAARFSR